jgi:hypothetical protein
MDEGFDGQASGRESETGGIGEKTSSNYAVNKKNASGETVSDSEGTNQTWTDLDQGSSESNKSRGRSVAATAPAKLAWLKNLFDRSKTWTNTDYPGLIREAAAAGDDNKVGFYLRQFWPMLKDWNKDRKWLKSYKMT